MNIVALTCLAMDLYVEHARDYVGGNALNVATQCRRSGVARVAVVGAVGRDAYGDAILHHLEATGIDVSHVYRLDGKTATHRMYLTAGDRQDPPDAWQGGVFDVFRPSDADWEFVNAHDIVAIGALDPNFEEAARRLGPQCKVVADFLDTRDFDRLERYIDRLDIAVLSAQREDIPRAQALSTRRDIVILLTLGAEGAVAIYNGVATFQPALPVADVVDTTGCGDAFQAAFFVSWFQQHDIARAMRAGAEAAAQILMHFGGV